MPQVIGTRTTYQVSSGQEDRLVRRVDDEIALLEPNEGPLITLLMRLKKRSPTDNPKFEWLEDDYVARWAQNSSATVNANAASTTVTVTDGTQFVPGDLLLVPQLVSSSAAPEMCRVTAVATNTLTVVRNVGSTGLVTIGDSAALRLLGTAYEENAVTPSAKTTAPTTKSNYTQIFRTSLDFSGTARASRVYGGPDYTREQRKKLKEHKIKMNSQLLWGVPSEALTGGPGGKPIRTTGGLNNKIATNVTDAGGILSRKTFDSFARQAFRYGNQEKLLLASAQIVSAVNAWAKSFLTIKTSEKIYGVNITIIETGHGRWMLVKDWMLENGVTGQNGFAGWAFSIDMEELRYRYLSANGENRDTHYIRDAIQDGRDGQVDEYLTEGGYQIKQEKYHAKLFNVTDYYE